MSIGKLDKTSIGKISGGCRGHGRAPACPNCGKELLLPLHHHRPHGRRHRGPHGPKQKEGEQKLAPPEISAADSAPTT